MILRTICLVLVSASCHNRKLQNLIKLTQENLFLTYVKHMLMRVRQWGTGVEGTAWKWHTSLPIKSHPVILDVTPNCKGGWEM